ncbi:helix-turn-helix domain-containing protein [candidate division KSB1 bacterium]|nr:helix-turn-helix domain-containing protein [candidate division KSB1 bacterium]NIR72290.1 helix-turn-helix domain-containing protein [candidate division KSB1 bacterium]NIS24261.1 helix-turn-helix domain-containing protein [candidate division KSB1 bacterium]NIT71176.1 helix-turn-helix domain-containing protein [candidate division KSB1 bacterium]NIU24880.1 helix-turn-helix domain-containing protein [candidate division KSB1 bacterium]
MNAKSDIEQRLLTVKEISKYLSFPLSTVYLMVERKEIPFKRFGKKLIRFDKKEIDEWIDMQYDRQYRRN